MKKRTLLFFLLLFVLKTQSQNLQMKYWFISPKKVEFTATSTVLSNILGFPISASQVANGVYDDNGDLLFYISNNNVYDYNNTLLGNIISGGAEIIIVPFDNNENGVNRCTSKYNIFSTAGGFATEVCLYKTVLDINSFYLAPSEKIDCLDAGVAQEFGAIAAGKINSIGNRFLYFLAGGGTYALGNPPPSASGNGAIHKLTIFNDGTVSTGTKIYPTNAVPTSQASYTIFSRELDLSPDGKWLAWANGGTGIVPGPTLNRYHYLALDNVSGDVAGIPTPYQSFNLPSNYTFNQNNGGFRGLEFYQKGGQTKLFFGAGDDGVFGVDISIPFSSSFMQVSGSNLGYGFSQIELSNNDYIFCSSGNNFIGAFDPTLSLPQILGPGFSFPFSSPPVTAFGFGGVSRPLYTLPDQIDGQNYAQITPQAISPVLTYNLVDFPSNTLLNQTASWSYGTGNNPYDVSTPLYIVSELRVKNKSILTIDGMTIKFSPKAKLIIEPGSTLKLINGTKLTSMSREGEVCVVNQYTWKGVEVWGGPTNQSQNIIPQEVGKLEVLSNSTIEFAEIGVRTYRTTSISNIFTNYGGIVISNTGKFINNRIDIDFKPYSNIFNGVEVGNKSNFRSTTFTNNLYYPFSKAQEHVVINANRGIRFRECSFLNTSNIIPPIGTTTGIKSLNSNFIVENNCLFSKLDFGINANRTSGTQTFQVFNSEFSDNIRGIRVNSINNFKILQNTFRIGGNLKLGANLQAGIETSYSTGFRIEENTFIRSSPYVLTSNNYGLMINECGENVNEVYKNSFQELTYANYARGLNKSIETNTGLQYLCNTNVGNLLRDFYIAKKPLPFLSSLVGIRTFQGSTTKSAGNSFSISTITNSHIENLDPKVITYYYDSNILNGDPINFNSNVQKTLVSNANTCPSKIPCPTCLNQVLTNHEIEYFSNQYDSIENYNLILQYSYNQLLDGGSTQNLLMQIQQSLSSDAIVLFNQLNSKSPYLSEASILEAANSNILSPSLILLLCLSNPDATRSNDFLDYLSTSIPQPLPAYMIDLIRASWDTMTARTALENSIADNLIEMYSWSNQVLQDMDLKISLEYDSLGWTDTTNYIQTINYWLNKRNDFSSKYDLIENYFSSGSANSARSLMDSIQQIQGVSHFQGQIIQDYNYFDNFKKNVALDNRDLSTLTVGEIEELQNFVYTDYNFAKSLAQNALCFYYGICRDEDYTVEESGNRIANNLTKNTKEKGKLEISCSTKVSFAPNPVINTALIMYEIPTFTNGCELVIYDISGKEIKNFEISKPVGMIYWDVLNAENGLYLYALRRNNEILNRGKFTISK
jgi:hypothetical protein